ncbi:MAG: ABC transporter permease, partial [Bacteroidota bacterium]
MKINPRPPRWADWFLEWYCKPELLEEIQGDIYEIFYYHIKQKGERAARRGFAWNVLCSFRLSTIRQLELFSTIMLRSNFKIAVRQMSKQKGFTAIKIGGFALGIAACILIGLYIQHELNYDNHYLQADRIYRMYNDYFVEGKVVSGTSQSAPIAAKIKEEYPEIELAGRIQNNPNFFMVGDNHVRRSDRNKNSFESGFAFADQEILDIFQYPMLYGDPHTALSEPNTIVLSEQAARKLFGYENPMGKSLIIENNVDRPFEITGVLAEFPTTSHLQYNFWLSMEGQEFWEGEQTQWGYNNYDVYMKHYEGADMAAFEEKLESLLINYVGPESIKNGWYENVGQLLAKRRLRAHPVSDTHLYYGHVNVVDKREIGDIRLVWTFSIVAFFILLLACINFVNLATAKSSIRMKEVGVRKVLGSLRSNMIAQFLIESSLYSLLSFVLGVLLASWFLPLFNKMAGKSLSFPWLSFWFIPSLLFGVVFIGLLAGLYPALYMSKYKPIEAFKGMLAKGNRNRFLSNGLVVFQFTVAIILITSTIVINQQMQYILNKEIGFDKEQVLLMYQQ